MTKILAIYDNHRTQQFHFGYVPKRTESRVLDRCSTPMITAAVFIAAEGWKQPQCPLVDERLIKIRSRHIEEYYSALKRKDILTQATAWMKLIPRDIR